MWREAAKQFTEAGLDNAQLDARLLLGHVLGLEAVELVVSEHMVVEGAQRAEFEKLVTRRLRGEPVARIFQEKEFYGLLFFLNDDTLVPRPETELLVDLGIEILRGRQEAAIADLGTGSGCVLIALLHELEFAKGVGVDISNLALEQAVQNARALGVEKRSSWKKGSWFEPLGGQKFDLIVSNPPYIAQADLVDLPREVLGFDPVGALGGGETGLEAYGQIIREAKAHLRREGALVLELGFDQADAVRGLCASEGFQNLAIVPDLAGHSRVIVARN